MAEKKDNGAPKLIPLKRAYAAYEIRKDDGKGEHSVYQHSILCQTFFPYRSPGDTDYWEKRQGNVALSVQADKIPNPRGGEPIVLGVPYGPKVRLIMAFLNTEILKQQKDVIEVSDSMTAFIRNDLKLGTDGRTIKAVKEQLGRLASSTIAISYLDADQGSIDRSKIQIIDRYDAWFPESADQKTLWTSYIKVTKQYAESLSKHAVPLDMRAVAAIANNPMALDIYTWLAYRLHWIKKNKPLFIPWAALHQQFGANYSKIRQFRAAFLKNLKEVKLVYPDARIEIADHKSGMPGGLMLYNSPPAIQKKLVVPPYLKKFEKSLKAGKKKEKST